MSLLKNSKKTHVFKLIFYKLPLQNNFHFQLKQGYIPILVLSIYYILLNKLTNYQFLSKKQKQENQPKVFPFQNHNNFNSFYMLYIIKTRIGYFDTLLSYFLISLYRIQLNSLLLDIFTLMTIEYFHSFLNLISIQDLLYYMDVTYQIDFTII